MVEKLTAESLPHQRKSDGLWVADAYYKGKRHTFTSKVKSTAVAKRREFVRSIEDGLKYANDKTTMATFMQHWIETIKGPKLRPNTRRGYESKIRKHLTPALGKYKVRSLEPEHVEELHRRMKDNGVGAGVIRDTHGILKEILKEAMRRSITTRNVADMVSAPKYRPKGRGHLTAPEARRMIATAQESKDPFALLWELRLFTGARQGETLGLTVDRVHIDDPEAAWVEYTLQLASIPMRHGCPDDDPCGKGRADYCPHRGFKVEDEFRAQMTQLHGAMCLVPTKTESSMRAVPIPPGLALRLRQHIAEMPENPWGLLWVSHVGTPIRSQPDEKAWYAALERADCPKRMVHASRNTAVTLLAEAGVEESVRMKIVGHSSVDRHRGYLDVSLDESRKALGMLSNLIDLGPEDYVVVEERSEVDVLRDELAETKRLLELALKEGGATVTATAPPAVEMEDDWWKSLT
ncbi:hypothetical protein CH289_07975 [Rhodococcus sp. RS1C4]|nr:site-specific integrase [Rhodococcus sp. RS1C4]OZC54867.1 hypothetical protein CH289_07975 [Rhodococcus sp. RS1C4]